MKTIKSTISEPEFSYHFPQKKEEILFFDIETTGLSPKTSSIYLIGVLYFDISNHCFMQIQWFAERNKDEKNVLSSFLEFLNKYQYLYHFNGKTFDIPFVLQKCRKHAITLNQHTEKILTDATGVFSIDLLARIRKLKHLLSLEKCNQKALERFLGIEREDIYSGGDLISVYSEYTQMHLLDPGKADALEKVLLLHNHEDVEMMLSLCSLLQYEKLVREPEVIFSEEAIQHMHIEQLEVCNATGKANHSGQETGINEKLQDTGIFLVAFIATNIQIPKKMEITIPYPETEETEIPPASFSFETGGIKMQFPLLSGTLKYFYPDYKNYYYLPAEDTAIHKSVAEFVDKAHREKATRENCHIKKEGLFLPNLLTPKRKKQTEKDQALFFKEYGDKLSFYALPEDFPENISFWKTFFMEQWKSLPVK